MSDHAALQMCKDLTSSYYYIHVSVHVCMRAGMCVCNREGAIEKRRFLSGALFNDKTSFCLNIH